MVSQVECMFKPHGADEEIKRLKNLSKFTEPMLDPTSSHTWFSPFFLFQKNSKRKCGLNTVNEKEL